MIVARTARASLVRECATVSDPLELANAATVLGDDTELRPFANVKPSTIERTADASNTIVPTEHFLRRRQPLDPQQCVRSVGVWQSVEAIKRSNTRPDDRSRKRKVSSDLRMTGSNTSVTDVSIQ